MTAILADTGVLVALLDRRERFHAWAVEQTRTLHPPLLLCEAVLAELLFLVADLPGGRAAVGHNLHHGNWRLHFLPEPVFSPWTGIFGSIAKTGGNTFR